MDTDCFILSIKSGNAIKKFPKLDHFWTLAIYVKILKYPGIKKNKKFIGVYKIETPKNIWIDQFVCLGGKMYVFKYGIDGKINMKAICKSQSKNTKFEV